MKAEHNAFCQLAWITNAKAKIKADVKQAKLMADWKAWKMKHGFQDGVLPSARELFNGTHQDNKA